MRGSKSRHAIKKIDKRDYPTLKNEELDRRTRLLQRRLSGKPPRATAPPITRKRLLLAIPGTYGIISRIAERLNSSPAAVKQALKRPNYGDVLEAYEDEQLRLVDLAEDALVAALKQRMDLAEASKNARWVLERKRSDQYQERKRVALEGGDRPIRVDSANVNLSALDLPIDVRKTLLAALQKAADQQQTSSEFEEEDEDV